MDIEGAIYRDGHFVPIMRAQVNNLSITGASFILDGKFLAANSKLLLHIYTSSRRLIALPIDKIHRQFKDSAGQVHVGVSFSNKLDMNRERLFEYLFVELPSLHAIPAEERVISGDLSTIQKYLSQRNLSLGSTSLLEDTLP